MSENEKFYNHNSTIAFYLNPVADGVKVDIIAPDSSYVAYSVVLSTDEAKGLADVMVSLADESSEV